MLSETKTGGGGCASGGCGRGQRDAWAKRDARSFPSFLTHRACPQRRRRRTAPRGAASRAGSGRTQAGGPRRRLRGVRCGAKWESTAWCEEQNKMMTPDLLAPIAMRVSEQWRAGAVEGASAWPGGSGQGGARTSEATARLSGRFGEPPRLGPRGGAPAGVRRGGRYARSRAYRASQLPDAPRGEAGASYEDFGVMHTR